MIVKSFSQNIAAQRPAAKPAPTQPEAHDRYEPTLSDRFSQWGGRAMICLPGAAAGALVTGGAAFVNVAPFLGLSAGLKTAACIGLVGAAGGAWLWDQLAQMD